MSSSDTCTRNKSSQVKWNAYVHGLLSKICGFHAKFHAYYCMVLPQTVISSAIEKKVKKGALQFRACSSFNVPEYRLLQACFNVETPLSLIFEPLVVKCLGVTRC